MYYFAFILLASTLLISITSLIFSIKTLWPQYSTAQNKDSPPINASVIKFIESSNTVYTTFLCLASAILIYAITTYDFSLQYAANYTDKFLPLFYRITAFWAGQAGSMLFWALAAACFGFIFKKTQAYKCLSIETKLWFWSFFVSTITFFGFVLITWNNPFIMLSTKPFDGNGLNPLLQNPGMIFHPPLLFLGYSGFIVPSCLALAQTINKTSQSKEPSWLTLTRPFILTAWGFLTAGIVLGGWWAYMELGWGGYWAWDPVENASLLPWLISTATLHTAIIQMRRDKLLRTNVLLMALTTLSTFFATYIVRSGVIQSVHAFGTGGVGEPLLFFVVLSSIVIIRTTWISSPEQEKTLSGIDSKEGFLIITVWLLIAIATLILLATMWPVFSSFWKATILGQEIANASGGMGSGAVGLTANFYNTTCLPLFGALLGILSLCPWLSWETGIKNSRNFMLVLGTLCVSAITMYTMGYKLPVAVLGASSACAIFMSTILLIRKKTTKTSKFIGYSTHLGVALIALGIAFSGPYKTDVEPIISEGESVKVGPFDVTLVKITEGDLQEYVYVEGLLEVRKNGKLIGHVAPQRRIYRKWGQMQFAEADTIPGLGNEFYASLLAVDRQNKALFRLSSTPLVNWIWIGGALMSIVPFTIFIKYKRKKHNASSSHVDQ